MEIGKKASIFIDATDELVQTIAKVSGDINPVHLNDDYAKDTIFGKRIAHGLLCINGISRVLGTILPGKGTILLSQKFEYMHPVYIGDRVEVTVIVKDVKPEKNIYVLDNICTNQEGKVVLKGESVVKWG